MIGKKIAISLLFIFTTLTTTFSQENNLENKIRKMMDVLGVNARFEIVLDNMIEIQKEDYESTIDDDFWKRFKEKSKKEGYNDLIELLIPIYKKHLTESEIDAIIAFYESKAGKSMISKFPIITQESMQAGAAWGENLGLEIAREMSESNELKFNSNLDDCSAFKTGKFSYKLPDGSEISLTRTEDMQIEKTEFGEFKAKVKWISSCRFEIYEVEVDNKIISDIPTTVNIYEINGNSYKYVSKRQDQDSYLLGEVEKVDK